jgi:hypothetical protein
MDGQTDGQTHRQTNRETYRHTERYTDINGQNIDKHSNKKCYTRHNIIMLCIITLSSVYLTFVGAEDIMLNVAMLNVVAPGLLYICALMSIQSDPKTYIS